VWQAAVLSCFMKIVRGAIEKRVAIEKRRSSYVNRREETRFRFNSILNLQHTKCVAKDNICIARIFGLVATQVSTGFIKYLSLDPKPRDNLG